MAQESFDSDDTEYQRAFAALEEIKLTKLRKFFRDNCLRDDTLCLMQSETELRDVLVKDLNLPFGHGFAFSRQWFKKYHGNDVAKTTSKQMTKTDVTNSDQNLNPQQEDEAALPVTVPANSKNERCETNVSRDLTDPKPESVENVCPDVYEKRKASAAPMDLFDQTNAQTEKRNQVEVADCLESVTINEEDSGKDICLEVSFSTEDERGHSGGPSDTSASQKPPKGDKNQEKATFQIEVPFKITNDEGNEQVDSQGLSAVEKANVSLDVGERKATKPSLETLDPHDAHLEMQKEYDPIVEGEAESYWAEDQPANSRGLSILVEDNQKASTNDSSIGCEVVVKSNRKKTISRDEENASCVIHDNDNHNDHEEGASVVCSKERGIADTDKNPDEALSDDEIKRANKKSSSKAKRKNKKQRKASKKARNAQTPTKNEEEEGRKEDNDPPCLESDNLTNISQPPLAGDGRMMEMDVGETTTPPEVQEHTDLTKVSHDQVPTSQESDVSLNKKKVEGPEKDLDYSGECVEEAPSAKIKETPNELSFKNVEEMSLEAEKGERPITVIQERDGVVDQQTNFTKAARCTPRPHGASGREYFYEKGSVFDIEESREFEFKSLVNAQTCSLPWKIMEKAKKFICGCLNAERKGIIYFGVGDSQEQGSKYKHGEILGLKVEDYKDDINKAFQFLLDDHIKSDDGPLQKGGEQNCVSLHFVPVKSLGNRTNLYVIEIEIARDWRFCKDNVYYTKSWTEKRGDKGGAAVKKALGDFFKVKDEYDEVAIRTNGASSYLKHHEVDKHVKKPLEEKYKEWRKRVERHGDQESLEEVSLDDADAKRFSTVLGERLHGLNHKEYGYILVANKLPAKYRGTEDLSFLQNIPWLAVFDLFDPNSKKDGLHYACNETTDAPRAKIRTLDDYKDVALDKDFSIRETTWILGNEEMQNGDWIKCSKDCLYRALSACKQCYPPGHLVCAFLCLSETSVHEMADIMESSFSILGNWASSCVTIISETRPLVDVFIKASKYSLQKELRECSISDIPWNLLKAIVREMVGPSNFNEKGATTELPFFTKKLKGVLNKIVRSWNDLEVYSPNPQLPCLADAIERERNAFYKGAQASQVNLFHNHSIPRTLEKEINTKVDKALRALSNESSDDSCAVKTITVPYEPGSGATTLCRRILWNRRKDYRCAVVKAITVSTDYQIEKLQSIVYDENNFNFALPVLVLVDNVLENDVRQLTERVMKRGTKCALLVTYPIAKSATDSSFGITPLRKLDETETRLVKDILINITSDAGKRKEVEQVLEREKRFIWFGLELFGRDYLKIEERLQNHIQSILTAFRSDSQCIHKSLLEMCCFLSKYSAGCAILPHTVLLELIQHTGFWIEKQSSAIKDVHEIFEGLLLEEQDETNGYYGWRPAHYLVSEVVTSEICIEGTAVRFLENVCKCKAYAVKYLRHKLIRVFLDRKRISDPVFPEEQGTDVSSEGPDLEEDVFGSYEVRTRYSPLIVDILDKENIQGALRVLIAICGEALDPLVKAYAWQQLARFIGYEMCDSKMCESDDLHNRLYRAMASNKEQDTLPKPKLGIEAAHIAIDIAINHQPNYGHHYVTKGDLYRLQLRKLEERHHLPVSLPKVIEICRKALEVYDKALKVSHGFNHYPMIGKIQAILSLLEFIKSLPCFNFEEESFSKYLEMEEIPREFEDALSQDEHHYVKSLSSTTLDVFNELFGNVKVKQTTTYDDNELRSLTNAMIRASKLRRAFYEMTGYDRLRLNGGQSPILLSSPKNEEPAQYQQHVEDILFIRDETPYSAWSNLSDGDLVSIYKLLKPICQSERGSHNDMFIFSKACLQLKDRPPVQELDEIVSKWVTKFPNSEWAHLFNYMVHFPIPNRSLASYNPNTVKASIRKCVSIVTEKAGFGFRKSGAEYFLGKGRGLNAIVKMQEFRSLERNWKSKTHFWRSKETTDHLERVQGQKDASLKGIIAYQGIQLHFDNTRYPNESKDDLWFYLGFSFAGPYAYDPVDNDTYAAITRPTQQSTSILTAIPTSEASSSGSKISTIASNLDRGKLTTQTNPHKLFASSCVASLKPSTVSQREPPPSSLSVTLPMSSLDRTYCDKLSQIDVPQQSTTDHSLYSTALQRKATKNQDFKGAGKLDVPVTPKPCNNWTTVSGRSQGTKKKRSFSPKGVDKDGKLRHGAFVLGVRKAKECPYHDSKSKHSTEQMRRCRYAHGWLGDTLESVCSKCTEENLPYCKEKVNHKDFIWELGPYLNADGSVWKDSQHSK